MNQDELSALFRKLGAPDPEKWASSQIEEGIPQLARFLFLREAWKKIVPEDDASWIDEEIRAARSNPDEAFAGIGQGLAKLRARGVTDDEVTDVVRGMQTQLLVAFCSLLDDPGGDLEPEVADMAWAFVQVDDQGNVLKEIGGLHESVLETDPTGREMRPRGKFPR